MADSVPPHVRTLTEEADGRWMTYAELARTRGITKASATRLVRRHKWRKLADNQGNVRVFVPIEAGPQDDDADSMSAMVRAISTLQDALSVCREQLDRERQRVDQAEARAEKADSRADKADAELAAERNARKQAEAEAAQLLKAVDQTAEQDRHRLGLLGRLRKAWRGGISHPKGNLS